MARTAADRRSQQRSRGELVHLRREEDAAVQQCSRGVSRDLARTALIEEVSNRVGDPWTRPPQAKGDDVVQQCGRGLSKDKARTVSRRDIWASRAVVLSRRIRMPDCCQSPRRTCRQCTPTQSAQSDARSCQSTRRTCQQSGPTQSVQSDARSLPVAATSRAGSYTEYALPVTVASCSIPSNCVTGRCVCALQPCNALAADTRHRRNSTRCCRLAVLQ